MKNGTVKFSTLIECVKAVHLSSFVDTPFDSAAGLFLVGPPGVMKTTIIGALENYETVLTLSDVNSKTLTGVIKSNLTSNTIKTLALPEVQRIYERDPRTAAGVEGTIRSLVEEGFHGAAFDDPTVTRFKAKATVIGAMTDKFRDANWTRWTDSGFARRFMWSLIRLKEPEILMNSVEKGRKAELIDTVVQMVPPQMGKIPSIDSPLRRRLRPLVRKQPHPSNVQYELLCRMTSVLCYYYAKTRSRKDPLETVFEFGHSILLGAEVTGLVVK